MTTSGNVSRRTIEPIVLLPHPELLPGGRTLRDVFPDLVEEHPAFAERRRSVLLERIRGAERENRPAEADQMDGAAAGIARLVAVVGSSRASEGGDRPRGTLGT